METTQIRQGDAYPLYFKIKDASGTIITPQSSVSIIAITIGNKTKKWESGVATSPIAYDSTSQSWMYPLTQTETLNLQHGRHDVMVRVKFASNDVISSYVQPLEVLRTLDREEL